MNEFKTGQKVNIKLNLSSGSIIESDYTIKWVENDRIALTYPEENMKYAPLFIEGAEIKATIYTSSGIKILNSVIIYTPLEDDFIIEYDEESQELSNIQRREYLRVNAALNITTYNKNDPSKATKTKTIDIGGGGIKFITKAQYEEGEIINFNLHLPDGNLVNGEGKVIKVINSNNNLLVIIKYVNMSEINRNRILKVCFAIQSKEIQNNNFKF